MPLAPCSGRKEQPLVAISRRYSDGNLSCRQRSPDRAMSCYSAPNHDSATKMCTKIVSDGDHRSRETATFGKRPPPPPLYLSYSGNVDNGAKRLWFAITRFQIDRGTVWYHIMWVVIPKIEIICHGSQILVSFLSSLVSKNQMEVTWGSNTYNFGPIDYPAYKYKGTTYNNIIGGQFGASVCVIYNTWLYCTHYIPEKRKFPGILCFRQQRSRRRRVTIRCRRDNF